MNRRREGLLLALGWAAWTVAAPRAAWAQRDWREQAVPMYTPQDFAAGLLAQALVPATRQFVAAAAGLVDAAEAAQAAPVTQAAPDTALPRARQAWLTALSAWAALAAQPMGPLASRRSAWRIDFHPTRPAQVRRAIAAVPRGADAMARTGSAGKGFAALEWLWWATDAPGDAAARAYASELARDIAREADALAAESAALWQRTRDEAADVALMSEALNQWLGGLEQLRMQGLLRPVLSARGGAPVLPRSAPGAAAAERQARWQTLAALARFDGAGPAPAPGQGLAQGRVTFESVLRGRGLNPLADRLRAAVDAVDPALQAAAGNEPAALQAAAVPLAALKALAEAELAPALDIRVGFSDADGD